MDHQQKFCGKAQIPIKVLRQYCHTFPAVVLHTNVLLQTVEEFVIKEKLCSLSVTGTLLAKVVNLNL